MMRKRNIIRLFCSAKRDQRGMAAVEFGLVAPMLVFSLVIMADLGLAVQERMNLDQALRAGAEFVMNNLSTESDIHDLIVASATGVYDPTANASDPDAPTVTVVKTCECPENPGTTIGCDSNICANDLPPSVYYQMTATKTYNAIILPDIALNTELSVQTR